MKIRDEDVLEVLTGDGIALDRWFALGSHLVGYVDDSGRLMAKIVEDDALAAAAVKFMRARGQVRELGTDGNGS